MPAYRYNRSTGIIRYARRNVGSVTATPRGAALVYVARIREHTCEAFDAVTAFRDVAARAMGFASRAALRTHNAEVRAQNRRRTAIIGARRASPPIFHRPEDPAAMVARIQQEARDVGETPLTAEQIMASWIRSAS